MTLPEAGLDLPDALAGERDADRTVFEARVRATSPICGRPAI